MQSNSFSKRRNGTLLLSALIGAGALFVGACSSPDGGGDGDGDGDVGGTGDGDNGGGPDIVLGDGDGDGDNTVITGSCGNAQRETSQLAPELLVLLDRSGSMIENYTVGTTSRWAEATTALTAALTDTQNGIDWGLKLYPDNDWCGVSTGANVDVAPGNAQTIIETFNSRPPLAGKTHTPTRAAVAEGMTYLAGRPDGTPRALVLVTDGDPNCMEPWGSNGIEEDNEDGNGDEAAAIAAVAQANAAGIPVYVIGFAVNDDDELIETLNAMANAGGKAKADPFNKYYTADNATEFQAAMNEISADAATCTFELAEAAPNATSTTVFLADADGAAIEILDSDASMVNGWTFTDDKTIEVFGAACDTVLASPQLQLRAAFDCVPR